MRNVTKTLQMFVAVLIATVAFAATVNAQSNLMTESFDGGSGYTPPPGWVMQPVSGTSNTVEFVTSGSWPTTSPYDGTRLVQFRSFYSSNSVQRLAMNTPISTVGYTNIGVNFAWNESSGYSFSDDRVEVQWSTDGTSWTDAGSFSRYNPVTGWTIKNLALPAGAEEQATLYIAFMFTSEYGYNCHLDLAHITGIGPPPPVTITLGTSTVTQGYPYYTFYMDSRTQMLYTAAEIIAAGGSAGEISWIAYDVSSANSATMNGFKARMKNTSATSATSWDNDMTTVMDGTYAVPGTGWQQLPITPFIWDGSSNLLVEICFNNSAYTSNSYTRATYNVGKTRHYHFDGGSTDGCTTTTGSAYSYRPNMRMFLTPMVGTLMGNVQNCFDLSNLVGATVSVGSFSTTTDASGNYTFYNIGIGNYTVSCTDPAFLPQTKPVTIYDGVTSTLDFCMEPIPAYLSGLVYNSDTGEPIVGAKIVAGGSETYSVAGGVYTLNIYPVGTFGVYVDKAGFEDFYAGPFTFVQGVVELLDIPMLRATYPAHSVVATLNTPETAVDINWMAPNGMMEIRYDDGICDNFTVWAMAGNMNAVKFTPLGFPINIFGGKVHIGDINNYPSGSNPLVPFQMAIYDDSGPMGYPGEQIGDAIDVSPSKYGWVDFSFPAVPIASGNFYLVMIQGGNAPNAAGICIDETDPQLRSYARFVTGSAPWVPASGNFMLRALVKGEGGPLVLDAHGNSEPITAAAVPGATYNHTPETVTGIEGQGMFQTIEWSTFNPSNTELPYITGSDPNQEADDPGQGIDFTGVTVPLNPSEAVLYNNGPLVNSSGTGLGGADESIVESPLTSYGSGFQNASDIFVADDFTVTGNTWNVTSMEFFGYQTNGVITGSSITGIFVAIWDGEPGAGGAVIWGDQTTNLLATTTWSNIYRNNNGPGGNTNRPIMQIIASTPGLSLDPGTYWVQWSATGSLSSGPWVPAVTISGQPMTGNAVQHYLGAWNPIGNAPNFQGLPFIVNGFEVTPAGDIDYQVWRLQQGEETNPGLWNSIGTTNTLNMTDNSWPSIACGPYLWAVKAIYQGNRISDAAFSNVIGKCNTAGVTVNVDLTCTTDAKEGTQVMLVNNTYPDTNYMGYTDTAGTVFFPTVWKGNYTMTINRFSYDLLTDVFDVVGDMTIDVNLFSTTTPPSNMMVDDRSLLATWSPPMMRVDQFVENFSGGFGPNMWTEDPTDSNWGLSTAGNPGNCAFFSWSPSITNYEQYLTSGMPIMGLNAPQQVFAYDLFLSNFGTSTVEGLAVEIWDGSAWNEVDNSTNTGNIAWTTKTVDISQYNDTDIKVRFKAYGEDSFNINNWNVDNVNVYSTTGAGFNPCVLGYNLYLNGTQIAFTPDTNYLIPPGVVQYGMTYNACVLAVYGSGYSAEDCYTFTSWFLCPPDSLAVEAVECAAYLTWDKPSCAGGGCTVQYLSYDNGIAINGLSINPGFNIQMGNYFPVDPSTTGLIQGFDIWFSSGASTAQSCIIYFYDASETLIGQSDPFINAGAPWPAGTWMNIPVADVPFSGPFYALVDYYVASGSIKNYFGFEQSTPQVLPTGLAWSSYDGVFGDASSVFGYAPPMTFMQRATICVTGKKGPEVLTLDPNALDLDASYLPTNHVTSPPIGAATNLGVNMSVPTGDPPTTIGSDSPEAVADLLGYNVYRDGNFLEW